MNKALELIMKTAGEYRTASVSATNWDWQNKRFRAMATGLEIAASIINRTATEEGTPAEIVSLETVGLPE